MSDYTILIVFHSDSKYDIFNHHEIKNRQVFQHCFLPMIIQINHKQMHFSHVVMQITALMWSLKVHTKLKTKNRRGMIDTQISAQYCTSHGLASAVKKVAKKDQRGEKNLRPLVITHHSRNMEKQLSKQKEGFTTLVMFSRSSYDKAGHSGKVA